MLIVLSALLALAVGISAGYYLGKRGEVAVRQSLTQAQSENLSFRTQLENLTSQFDREKAFLESNHRNLLNAEKEKAAQQIVDLKSGFETEKKALESGFKTERENLRNGFESERKALESGFEAERKALKELNEKYRETEEEMQKKTELLKTEFQNLANQILEKKSSSLKEDNKDQMNAILAPMKQHLEQLEKSVDDTRASGVRFSASIKTAIEGLMAQTEKIGSDAVELAKALKGNSKTQGDWGEMILERMLEESGLRKDEEYFIQENFVTEEGKNQRPDVIVRFPEERCVIIDSKVSLTAYANYMNATDEQEREKAMTAHLASVRAHVNELAKKDYSKVVKNAIGYVLMFVPNEGSYIAAVERDRELLNYAYKQNIIVIGPSNLMMALQLAYNLWRSEKQSRNVEEIIKQGTQLYEKCVTFTTTFEKIGDRLDAARKDYDSALGTLAKGQGNIISKLEKMRSLGLSPAKKVSSKLVDAAEEDPLLL